MDQKNEATKKKFMKLVTMTQLSKSVMPTDDLEKCKQLFRCWTEVSMHIYANKYEAIKR